jgi:hypothetical protein
MNLDESIALKLLSSYVTASACESGSGIFRRIFRRIMEGAAQAKRDA